MRERPDFHPEPSAFEHIRIVTERLIPLRDPELTMSGILHDICKFDTMKINPPGHKMAGFPTSPGHAEAAHQLIMSDSEIQNWISNFGANTIKVSEICKNHMRFHQLSSMRETKRIATIQSWTLQGIFQYLKIFGAADNMMEDFDVNNLEKSWKNLQ